MVPVHAPGVQGETDPARSPPGLLRRLPAGAQAAHRRRTGLAHARRGRAGDRPAQPRLWTIQASSHGHWRAHARSIQG